MLLVSRSPSASQARNTEQGTIQEWGWALLGTAANVWTLTVEAHITAVKHCEDSDFPADPFEDLEACAAECHDADSMAECSVTYILVDNLFCLCDSLY